MLVHQVFDIEQVLLVERRIVGEVEPQAVRRHQRPGLLHVRAERLPQCRVEQVRRRVVAAGGIAALNIHFGCHQVADAQPVTRFGFVRDQAAHRIVGVRDVRHLVVGSGSK